MIYLKISLLLLLTSCGGWGKKVRFDPDFYAHDYESSMIINAKGVAVYCDEENFNHYASLSLTQIGELAAIITKARVPKSFAARKRIILKRLNKALVR